MADISFSPEAVNDLKEIKKYISDELDSVPSAVNTVRMIMKRIRILETFPASGAPLSSIIDIQTPYRFLVCGNYVSFYKIEEENVRIIRVLYGKRNYMQILFGESDMA